MNDLLRLSLGMLRNACDAGTNVIEVIKYSIASFHLDSTVKRHDHDEFSVVSLETDESQSAI